MRPKLKPDVFWVPSQDGVAFVHAGGYLNISGKSAHALTDRLAPYLDGTTPLDDLVDGLPEGKRTMVTTLVTALAKAGMVKDTSKDEPHSLDDSLLTTYAAEIAYIDYYLPSAARRFQRYRETPTVCVGSGLAFTALVHACLRSGLRDLTALVSDEHETDVGRLEDYAAQTALKDPAQRFAGRRLLPGDEALHQAVSQAGLVLHIGDVHQPARSRSLDRLCHELGKTLVQGALVDDEAWIGPVGGAVRPGWESVWMRRGPSSRPYAQSPYLAGPTAGIVANRISFLAFRHITGVEAADRLVADPADASRPMITRIDLETLQTTSHRCHPHPGAAEASVETEAEFADRYAAFTAATAPASDDFSAKAATLYDPYLGVFTSLDEQEHSQIPLRLAEASVSDPFGLLGVRPMVHGAGKTLELARRRCGEAALRAYASLAVDIGRLREDGEVLYAYAQNLILGKAERVDARLAHPILADLSTGAFTIPLGLVSGATADEALTRGLLDHCVARTVLEARTGETPFPRLGPEVMDGIDAEDSLSALRIAGVDIAIYDITGSLGVETYAVCADGKAAAYVAGAHLSAGLEQAVLAYQTGGTNVPDLPATVRGTQVRQEPPATTIPSWREMAEILHSRGAQVHALPAGHDPAVTGVLPTLVQVVVHD
ncbi:hypothetical protein [Spongiactinospora sp. TRM90649]|uniref:hypothetical protein n=1 Tax=Spongiactinospora sp. TRM90649 TaxID=3031114 RepID=UPI0023F81071|nr:hypothetical protein [Spongiactinospora sp. TRM90649]MDF5756350.1 hypothetical protein [Spongiactinospora sp. TRM90649]